MGYWAEYEAHIKCKELLPDYVIKDLDEAFENVDFNDKTMELTFEGYDKYYCDTVKDILRILKPFCVTGCINYAGEDGANWRFIFRVGEWEWKEEDGRVVYDSDLPVQDANTLINQIIGVVQNCLNNTEEKTIKGDLYDKLYNRLEHVMRNWKLIA